MAIQAAGPTAERVLALLPADPEGASIGAALKQGGLPIHPCADVPALCRELEAGAGTAVLAEEVLDQAALQLLVPVLERQPGWSDFPLVVLFSPKAETPGQGRRMLGLLEPLGNVTVLERPVQSLTLLSAVQTALRARRHQYELRDLLRQREEAVRARDEFLTRLAHELRTPLSNIWNASQILGRFTPPGNVAVEQRGVIERQVQQLARLVRDVLDVCRAAAGKLPMHPEPVDLVAVARRCLHTAEPDARARRQQLSFAGGPEPVVVEGDAERLEQVICHLLGNAVRFTPPGGRIALAVGREDDTAFVRVSDNGAGIGPDLRPHLFEQGPEPWPPVGRPEGGLRLGLTLVRHLVELHGGSISAASPGPGQGSEFTVRLPAKAPVDGPPAPPATNGHAAPARHRILLVEDDPDGRDTLGLMLQLWGHDVKTAADGPQGIQKALAHKPDVVLLDIGLPGMDGYAVARKLREALGDRVLLLALTGYGQDEDRRRTAEAGFDAHLVKPVDPEALHQVLAGGAAKAGAPGERAAT